MTQTEKATRFAKLHVKGTPLILYNAWDAGSAKAIVEAGAKAIATSSWAVAAAQGYQDGEAIPFELAQQIYARIVACIDVPLTVDFEGGYSEDDNEVVENIARLLDLGVIGINFEDRVVKGSGLYDLERQARRIAAIGRAAEQKRIPLFINARTDLFLGQGRDPAQAIGEALERGNAYAAVGASGFFIPGLDDDALIGQICDGVALPVNVMILDSKSSVQRLRRLGELGVSRISYGPHSYIRAMASVSREAGWAHSSLEVRPQEKDEGPEQLSGWFFDK